jgi:hypothetical protein
MGLDTNGVQCILHAQSLGVDFARSATIGRQRLHLDRPAFKAALARCGVASDDRTVERVFTKDAGFADEFLRCLGASDVHSFDNSDYEGATHLHDMNEPIPDRFKGQYSVVLDSGSLEHVFNFPVAIGNCMEMVRVGGHYVGITPANNFMGHGFYQFSPALFYEIFAAGNGYELLRVVAFEDSPRARWFAVARPASVRSRVTLINGRPVYLLVIARRVGPLTPFVTMPQQHDYVSAWHAARGSGSPADPAGPARRRDAWLAGVGPHLPPVLKRMGKWLLGYDRPFDPRYFTPIQRCDDGAPIRTLGSTARS